MPLNSLWGEAELEYAMGDSACKILFADPDRMRLCGNFIRSAEVKTVLCRPADHWDEDEFSSSFIWSDVIAAGAGAGAPSTEGIDPDDECMYMYTSGTTGFPKGVVHTQRGVGTLLKTIELGTIISAPGPADKILLAVPLFHITAISAVFLMSLPTGSAIVMMYKWDPAVALDLIENEQITGLTGVPTMVQDILMAPEYREGAFCFPLISFVCPLICLVFH